MTDKRTLLFPDPAYMRVADEVRHQALEMLAASEGRPWGGPGWDDEVLANCVFMVVEGCRCGPWQGWHEVAHETAVAIARRTARSVIDDFRRDGVPAGWEARPGYRPTDN